MILLLGVYADSYMGFSIGYRVFRMVKGPAYVEQGSGEGSTGALQRLEHGGSKFKDSHKSLILYKLEEGCWAICGL